MCGIVGYSGYQNAKNVVIDGLKTLEYRGYDSAGIALCKSDIQIYKSQGRVATLERTLPYCDAHVAIGHTRWATHGAPSARNAHPHLSFDGEIAIVHNGVIDNFEELKAQLSSKGITFKSSTDSEIIAHLIALEDTSDMLGAMRNVGKKLKGATTFLAIKKGDENIYARRMGASLAIGFGKGENFVASDTLALSKNTHNMAIMQDGEYAIISPDFVKFYDNNKEITKPILSLSRQIPQDCACHMRSEIDEIPSALLRTYSSINKSFDKAIKARLQNAKKIYFCGCGTAYHAGLYGKYVFEKTMHVPCESIVASEFDTTFIDKDCAVFFISQSGETQDTLLALKQAKAVNALTIAITNVPSSTICFEADKTFLTDAGAEIAVAATKSYNCQLLSLYLIAKLTIGENVDKKQMHTLLSIVQSTSAQDLHNEKIKDSNIFFVGKGIDYVTAQEGALKLKEITYKMTDAYQAGELKHGTIALIDGNCIVIAIATSAEDYARIKATVCELRSRGASVIALSAIGEIGADKTLLLHRLNDDLLYPLISIIPLQNLALSTSLCLGLNPDKPRNLAKSVTVI